jgi:hypothetical protein
MQMHKFFVLKTPVDLLRKLEREYDRWKADPLNVDFAWNFFVTAEHLPDWIYYQDMPTSGRERPDLLDGQKPYEFKMALTRPIPRICSHLANGAKHFHLHNPNLTSVAGTGQAMVGWAPDGWAPDGWVPNDPVLQVSVTSDEQDALKQSTADIDVLWLAARVLEFWHRRKIC